MAQEVLFTKLKQNGRNIYQEWVQIMNELEHKFQSVS